jgi:hypothetical protein
VSSGRRRHFFKRGGQLVFTTETSKQLGTYSNDSRRVASFSQIEEDKKQREKEATDKEKIVAAQKAATLDYPDVDTFVQNIKPNNTNIIMENKLMFSILKLPQKTFETSDVRNREIPVTRKIYGKTVAFYISHSGCNFYIYVDNTLYGQLQITAQNGTVITTDTICSLVHQIKLDLISSPT